MALGPTSITEEREKAIDFTQPFDFEPWDIMIPASIENVDLVAYLMPFSGMVWLGLLLSSLVVAVALYTFAQVSAAPKTMYPRQVSPRLYSAPQYIFDTLAGLVTQGNNQPQTPSVRALAGWWWLFCVIIIASYSSKLISSITVRLTAPVVTSMLDMVESRRILWTYQANSAMEELFKNSDPSSMFGKVGQLHREMPELIVPDFQAGVDAVREKKLAYVEVTLDLLSVVSVDSTFAYIC
ncbi:probable glutamate receptor [Penaeus monodon]|uniref:probable glutamate receptor n=1 Tax=Penaeus monodon TaxID=6687 RepID=UPI0018A7CB31|nr:probable glutamate receptor [Penaeus monodon]